MDSRAAALLVEGVPKAAHVRPPAPAVLDVLLRSVIGFGGDCDTLGLNLISTRGRPFFGDASFERAGGRIATEAGAATGVGDDMDVGAGARDCAGPSSRAESNPRMRIVGGEVRSKSRRLVMGGKVVERKEERGLCSV